jgi:hypothetical protein
MSVSGLSRDVVWLLLMRGMWTWLSEFLLPLLLMMMLMLLLLLLLLWLNTGVAGVWCCSGV